MGSAHPTLAKSPINPIRSFKETPIIQESSTYENAWTHRGQINGFSKVAGYQNSFTTDSSHVEIGTFKTGSRQNDIPHTCVGEISISANSPAQISSSQIRMTEIGIRQIGTVQDSTTHIGVTQVGPTQVDSGQISATEIDFSQVGILRVTDKSHVREVPFPSLISTNQILDQSSLSTHALFTVFSQNVPTLFNLENAPFVPELHFTLEFANLPIGQLAEAEITGFDSTGRPNSGILTLDYNANGKGWFIDTTPWENSEFGIQNSETSFQAQPGSEASGKYDLGVRVIGAQKGMHRTLS